MPAFLGIPIWFWVTAGGGAAVGTAATIAATDKVDEFGAAADRFGSGIEKAGKGVSYVALSAVALGVGKVVYDNRKAIKEVLS